MVRIIITIKKRKGISRAQFMEYYEKHHVPFVSTLLPGTKSLYRRNFIIWDDPILDAIGDGRAGRDLGDDLNPFDCFTETERNTREEAEEGLKRFFESDVLRKIKADEDEFVEPDGTRFYVVETRG